MDRARVSGSIIILGVAFASFLYFVELSLFYKNYLERVNSVQSEKVYYGTQFFHPYYYFFYSDRPDIVKEVNQGGKVPWIDERGYGGGLGPESKGERKLAFLVGGSTAFGAGASHPSQTLTAHLNNIQKEYFFVNTGVSSWNSYQELLRVLKQILPHSPELIVSLTGANDITNAYHRREFNFPPDTPDGYEFLFRWVENIRSSSVRSDAAKKYLIRNTLFGTFIFYNLREVFNLVVGDKQAFYKELQEKGTERSRPLSRTTAQKMHQNLNYMHQITTLNDADYVAILQPYKRLYPNAEIDTRPIYKFLPPNSFYRSVINEVELLGGEYIYNLTVWNELTPSEVEDYFVDYCHFNDQGYRRLAEAVWSILENRK